MVTHLLIFDDVLTVVTAQLHLSHCTLPGILLKDRHGSSSKKENEIISPTNPPIVHPVYIVEIQLVLIWVITIHSSCNWPFPQEVASFPAAADGFGVEPEPVVAESVASMSMADASVVVSD